VSLPADVKARLLQEHPWLTEADFAQKREGHGGGGGGGGHAGPPAIEEPAEDLVPLAEERIIVIAEELEAIRHEWRFEDQDDMFFYTKILGGLWTAAHVGVVADGVGGYARAGLASDWCRLFH
jgi:hypothetical protein